MSEGRARRITGPGATAVLTIAAVAVLAVADAASLWRICGEARGLPLWDPAEHGLAGVDLASALRRADVAGFLLGVNRQVLWPFVHSLLLAPWVLAFGDGFAAADRLSSALFAAAVIALALAGLRLHPTRGAWAGAAAAALALLAPAWRVFGTATMLEMPGGFLLALAAWLTSRAQDEGAPRGVLVAAGIAGTALFFCKYNYGLLWLAPVALYEWGALPATVRSGTLSRLREWVVERRWLRPFPLFVLAYLAILIGIGITGGGVLAIGPARVSVRSPGNPAYGLWLVLVVAALWRVRRAGGFRAAFSGLTPRHRILLATVAVPIAVWFLVPYPSRFREFLDFVVNRDSGGTLPSALLFYPRAFAADYAPAPAAGWIVLALALIPPIARRPGRDPAVLLWLALWIGLVATAAHPYRQSRFLFTVAPLAWLCAARNAVVLAETGFARLRFPAWVRGAAWAAGLAGLLLWPVAGAPDRAATIRGHEALQSPPGTDAALDRVLAIASASDARPWLLGHSNRMSPALLRWYALLARPEIPREQLPERPTPLDEKASEAEVAARIERLRRGARPVIAVLPAGPGRDEPEEYRREIAADRRTAEQLARDPGVSREGDRSVPGTNLRISVYRFTTGRDSTARP